MKLNIVPARTGMDWARLGVQTFLKQPLALAALFFMYMAAVILIAQIPRIGILLGSMLVPAATLGFMAASEQAARGKFPLPSVLVTAFRAGRDRARSMLVLGVIYALGSLAATGLAALVTGSPAPGDPAAEVDATTLLSLAFHLPLFLMFWHAPALVHWHGVTPAKSLFFSVIACLRNLSAFLVYAAAWMVMFMVSGLVFGSIAALLGGATLARAVMTPVALLMATMFSASIYFTFRDSFVADGPADARPANAEGGTP